MTAKSLCLVVVILFTNAAGSVSNVDGGFAPDPVGLKAALLQVFAKADTDEHQTSDANSSVWKSQNALKRNPKPSAADMESAITDLILGGGKDAGKISGGMDFAATPFGNTVKKIKAVIEKEMMPEVLDAHSADQKELDKLAQKIQECNNAKVVNFKPINKEQKKYFTASATHKPCRADEAIKHTTQKRCFQKQAVLKKVKLLRCKTYADIARTLGDTTGNRKIVARSGAESAEVYVTRLTQTFCGQKVVVRPGKVVTGIGMGGAGKGGFLDKFLTAKIACQKATKEFNDQVKLCKTHYKTYRNAVARCNAVQVMMDGAACKRATLTKDACETYAECYRSTLAAYKTAKRTVISEERDRKVEWRGMKRIHCIIGAFEDNKVTHGEIDACKKKTHSTNHLIIKYPKIPPFHACQVPKDYPTTKRYLTLQYAPLPSVAKGKTPPECTGMVAISTTPKKGSPKGCKCEIVTLNGPYSAGSMVKCKGCHDVRRSKEKNSCPRGTKLFAPASRSDWSTFIGSADPLRDPYMIVDITRPQNGCAGCGRFPMNSGVKAQMTWTTKDGSPWWLRSTPYSEPNGDYRANCYLDLFPTLHGFPPDMVAMWKGMYWKKDANHITYNDNKCNYHSKSYYCEKVKVSHKPRPGSPKSCKCTELQLTGKYSAKVLMKCEQCLKVYKSTQKNSCPIGMKIFSPASRQDWKTFILSAKPLRAPHWIIDITRPQNGCGGCTRYPMNSKAGQQATWKTSDKSPWWLRSTRYNEPNGDYHANCFLDLWRTPANENNVQFNDGSCHYRSRSYYCQPKKGTKRPGPPKPPSPPACVGKRVKGEIKIAGECLQGSKGKLVLAKCTNKSEQLWEMPACEKGQIQWLGVTTGAQKMCISFKGILAMCHKGLKQQWEVPKLGKGLLKWAKNTRFGLTKYKPGTLSIIKLNFLPRVKAQDKTFELPALIPVPKWKKLTSSAIGSVSCAKYQYKYEHSGKSYYSPITKLKWNFNKGQQLTGTYKYDGGSLKCVGHSKEKPTYGIGCSGGPGNNNKKVLPIYTKNEKAGTGEICHLKEIWKSKVCTKGVNFYFKCLLA